MARRILLADDSVTAQNMGRKILSDAGYEVITVNNGAAALKKIAEQKPDLIVLDVYMPGYSGLEVCQRIKDTRETSRIPILLTVGKLEPFKPEEARRAHADAYIVKPFEASELLVALTKLEDKIVPQADSYKPGRFAKAIAAVERFNHEEPQESFGDKDSGWKARIKFPTPGSRPSEPEAEETHGKKTYRDEEEKPAEPDRGFNRPIPEGLPKDITPAEIEAITAAAAHLSGDVNLAASSQDPEPDAAAQDQPASELPEPVTAAVSYKQQSSDEIPQSPHQPSEEDQEEQGQEAAPVTFANSSSQSTEGESVAEAPASQEGPMVAELPGFQQAPMEAQDQFTGHHADDLQTPEAPAQLESRPAEQSDAPAAAKSDSEVAAALQNLAPPNGNGSTQLPADQPGTKAPGPRWIAESVALESHETNLALETEMHKAFAAFAAADNSKATFADIASFREPPQSDVSHFLSSRTAEPHDCSAQQPSKYDDRSDAQPAAATELAETSSPAPGTSPESLSSVNAESSAPSEPSEAPAMIETSAGPASNSNHPVPPASPAGHRERSPETAAQASAWENWQHIRDAVADSTANVAEAAAAALANSSAEATDAKPEALAAAAGAGNTSSTSEGDASVASIVDSVLAELKPKLMEEIAKKMKKDQK